MLLQIMQGDRSDFPDHRLIQAAVKGTACESRQGPVHVSPRTDKKVT